MGQERLLSHYNGGGFSPFLQHCSLCCSQMSWVQVIIDTAAHIERAQSRLEPIQVTITRVLAKNRRVCSALWPVHQILARHECNFR